MSKNFHYTLANCNKYAILGTMKRLSTLIDDEFGVLIKSDKLAVRFIQCVPFVDISPTVINRLPFQETDIDSLEIFGTFFRGDLAFTDLEYDYLKDVCFEVANKLKSDGVVKIAGGKLLALLSSAIGYKSHQAFKSASASHKVMPKFKRYRFEDAGQDFHEFITCDGLVVDCQPYQSGVWCGSRGSVLPQTDQFRIIFSEKYARPDSFDTLEFFNESTFLNYSVVDASDVDEDYKAGFMAYLSGEDRKPDCSKEWGFGYNVAAWNTGRTQNFKSLILAD